MSHFRMNFDQSYRSNVARQARKTAPLFTVSLLAICNPAIAYAQENAREGDGKDIIVTANRRSESVQRVASSVTALNPVELSEKGLGSLGDVVRSAPAVNFQEVSPGVNRVDMRGVTTGTINVNDPQDRPLVAFYLDDTPLSLQGGNPDLRVVDLERIEVIRGPQGTLYGAGSMAGTIRYITEKPSVSGIKGWVEGTTAITQAGDPSYSIRGVLNLPVTNTLAVRLGGYQGRDGGYIDNLGTGKRDANSATSTQFRGAVRWKPVDRLTLDASFTLAKLDTDGLNTVFQELPRRLTYTSQSEEGFDDNLKIYNLTAGYDFEFLNLVTSTTKVVRDNTFVRDRADAARFFGMPRFDAAPSITTNKLRDFSQEVRLVTTGWDWIQATVGGFYQRTKRDNDQNIIVPGFDEDFGALIGDPDFTSAEYLAAPDHLFTGAQSMRERQYALFGEAKFTFGRFDFTAGLRWFDFKLDFSVFNTGIAGSQDVGVPLSGSGTTRSKGTNPRFVAAYRATDDLMFYAEAAKGFRYGGVNGAVPESICGSDPRGISYGPDHLWSYTIGEKGQFFDRAVTLNLAAFYVKWRDVQTTKLLTCGYTTTENNGSIDSRGLELESRFEISDAFTISANGAYTNATAKGAIANVGAVDGDRVPFFPRFTGNIAADYTVPVGDGEVAASADLQLRSASFTQFSPADPLRRKIPASQIFNMSLRYTAGSWEYGLYATNILNDRNISLVVPGVPLEPGDRLQFGRPRTLGARIKKSF